jgi:serine/threonine-protein kinase
VSCGSDPQAAAGVREGEILAGKYRVDKVLGVGGMGVVVAARHVDLDNKVAIKFLLPALLANPEAVLRFAREARAAVKITCENVARVFDVGTLANGAPYMVMEFLEGGDLAEWLRQRGPLPIEQAVDFVLQACVAVADAHSLGMVHRDLKPANLFCIRRSDGQFVIKVLDFGISKLLDHARGSEPPGVSVTQTAAVMGSPLYMSPEQVQSAKDVDARTDLWALGVVLFQLLTGTVPFQGEAFGEIAIKIATQETPSLRGYRPEAPPALDAIIGKCLAKDRKRRYANVAELALALLPFASKRATASVERITGIIRAAGLSASALGMPPSPQTREKTMLAPQTPETGAPWSAPDETRGSGKKAMVGVVAVVVAVLVLVCGMISIRWLSPRGQAANSGSVTTLPPPRPEAALPAAAVTTDETPTPERLVPPPSTPTMPPTAPPLQKQTTTIPSPPPTKHNVSPPPAVATVTIPNAVPKAVPKPDCDPNFTLDDQGRKHWKPECFAK